MPDLTILLDCPPDQGLGRLRSAEMQLAFFQDEPLEGRIDPERERRYEMEPFSFHLRVREGYLKMADREPDRWRVVDASPSIDEVANEVWRHVSERLPEPGTLRTPTTDALERPARA